jgi:hypothetical protein
MKHDTMTHHCAQCQQPGATNEFLQVLTPWMTRFLCDTCAGKVQPPPEPKPALLRQACGICGQMLHVLSTGTVYGDGNEPMHRSCRRAMWKLERMNRPRQSTYHGRPWSMLTATERRWEEQWNEDHLDDLERDREETE